MVASATRRCSHRGSWKVNFPASGVGWIAGCGRQWRCGVPWLFRQRLFRGGVVAVAAAVGKIPSQIPQKTSSFSTPNRGGFARYLLAVFFADVS
eukprot:scaffold16137_cov51-Cyclotella_meneghiniana.AAC.2